MKAESMVQCTPNAFLELRFRVSRTVFSRLFSVSVLGSENIRRGLRCSAAGLFGSSHLQKVVRAMRMLAYRNLADSKYAFCFAVRIKRSFQVDLAAQ